MLAGVELDLHGAWPPPPAQQAGHAAQDGQLVAVDVDVDLHQRRRPNDAGLDEVVDAAAVHHLRGDRHELVAQARHAAMAELARARRRAERL